MTKRIAINGFGRIGRLSLRAILKRNDLEIVTVNDLTEIATLAHLFKFDSAHGIYQGEVSSDDQNLIVDGRSIKVLSERNPEKLPWNDMGIDMVVESTGLFTSKEEASKHLEAGASKVVISAPAKGDVKTIVLGVNDDQLTAEDNIISNASCTTNCLAPMVKILDENWGLEKGFMTTVHAYTSDQRLQDAPHKDLRRARAAAFNMVPTSTGAAKAVGKVLPHLDGKLAGGAVRVPVIDGSLTEFTCILKKSTDIKSINQAFSQAAGNGLSGILEYSEAPLVSSDIVGNTHSCIFDAPLTQADGTFVKVVGWYDNEAGYSSRVVDLLEKMALL
ncbi:MAG: type I glyceraldehyde-3-phosphate dehydrogenase [Bacteroidetes bacterium]|nr:type I glyceraldehyde-3-phosphate dehydrogenase [Bacteroidota bacterium]